MRYFVKIEAVADKKIERGPKLKNPFPGKFFRIRKHFVRIWIQAGIRSVLILIQCVNITQGKFQSSSLLTNNEAKSLETTDKEQQKLYFWKKTLLFLLSA